MDADTRINPLADSSLVRLARIALETQADARQLPWEDIDLDDPAQRCFGDYELLELLGRGGMGVVYRAHQRSLARDVAIKFIASGLADDPRMVAQFLAEAQAAARLHHPNIVPVFEVGSVDCLHFFSMPLLRGSTLAERHAAQPLALQEVLDLMDRLCSAVGYAHSLGLLHLDLKPANVMLDERGQPLIGDFGLARRVDEAGGVDAQEVSGTPAFMAPEQVLVRQFRLTAATDIYAVGAILYFLLSGHSPHGFGDAQVLMQNAVAGRVVPLRELAPRVPRDLAAICEHCLHLHGRDRYASAGDLAADLARFRDGNPVSVRSAGPVERLLRSVRRNPALSVASSLAVLALLVGFAVSSWQWSRAEDARRLADAERAVAQQQRAVAETRATQMKQLAAMLAVTAPDESYAAIQERQRRARQLIEWLHLHGGSPAEQRALLGVFADALRQAGKSSSVDSLLWEIPTQMGRGYRIDLSTKLASRADRDSLIAAVVLLIPRNDHDPADPLLDERIAMLDQRFADDPLALATIALACDAGRRDCSGYDLRRRLRTVAADHSLAWTHGFGGNDALDAESLAGLARAERPLDAFPDLVGIVLDQVIDQPMPAEVTEPLRALMSEREAQLFERRDIATAMPVVGLQPLTNACDPQHSGFLASHRDDCLAIARRMFRTERAAIIVRMTAGAMLRRLLPGSAEAAEALEMRRQMLWINQQPDRIEDDAAVEAALAFDRETAELGEWPAFLRLAERRGIASLQPPAGWQPRNPQDLLLPEQRTPPR